MERLVKGQNGLKEDMVEWLAKNRTKWRRTPYSYLSKTEWSEGRQLGAVGQKDRMDLRETW